MLFRDRRDAAEKLSKELLSYKDTDTVILSIPRGGVVVGFEVARKLDAPLDLIIPRKIGAPGNPELAIGAVTQDGTVIMDHELMKNLRVSESYLNEETKRQIEEIKRRMKRYRGDRPFSPLEGKTVIIVDDGIATGATMLAAIHSVRKKKPASIIVAVPVAPYSTLEKLRGEADGIVCLSTPEPFFAIGQFYQNFEQVSDDEVVHLLGRMRR